MTYQQFQAKWLGKRVDIDKVYGYQCVDLIKQYMLETAGVPNGAYGNAIDYWFKTHNAVSSKFDRVQGSNAKAGDIVILKGINGNPYGHIGVASGNTNLVSTQILEQNGSSGNGSGLGGDAIRLRYIPRWRVVGMLRLKTSGNPSYYTVRKGDTVTSICRTYGITINKFKALNPQVTNINLIHVGQKVRVK
jgi:hypothetical protein